VLAAIEDPLPRNRRMVSVRASDVSVPAARILLVEDDESLRFGLERNLRFEGYDVVVATDGKRGLELAIDGRPDLIILDIMLPQLSGFELCETLRKHRIRTPVIFLSAKSMDRDKITGLELGGDDYITKPFSVGELLARVKSVLRRSRESEAEPFTFGDVTVDFRGRSVELKGKPVELTSREFQLLSFLIQSRGKVLSRDTILQQVWGFDYYGTARTIDNFVNRLRQKVEKDANQPEFIVTVRGVGYKFSG
jgi:two-component system alkaline phosphatase synthesis response regulator PhoP